MSIFIIPPCFLVLTQNAFGKLLFSSEIVGVDAHIDPYKLEFAFLFNPVVIIRKFVLPYQNLYVIINSVQSIIMLILEILEDIIYEET